MRDSVSNAVIAAVALPPPLHGQSIVNAKVVDALREEEGVEVRVFDLSPGLLTRNYSYHLDRIRRVLGVLVGLVAYGHYRRKTIYMVVQAQMGVVYSLMLVALSRLLRFRVVLHHHSRAYISRKKILHWLLVKAAGPSATHVVLSGRMRDELASQYAVRPGSCLISSNACHIDEQAGGPGKPSAGVFKIGLLSNLSSEKGLDLVVATACEAVDRGLAVSLVLAGPVVGRHAEETVASAQRRLGSRVEYLGAVDGELKRRFFETVDVFLFPSTYRDEAQPLVLLEAMSYGIPLIVSDHGYIQELVHDAAVVLPADERFAHRAVERIVTWMDDRNALLRSGTEARSRFNLLHQIGVGEFKDLIGILCSPSAVARPCAGVE